ncbi:MAG: alpha/beta hydrolase [Betaproteobacteria bacterium]|nr:alpha/beta hydrolase [Betaproteobacteria bacterium]
MTTLVLLPGLDGTEVLLRPLLAELPPSIRPLVVTYPTSGDNSYRALLALARQVIAGVDECVVLGWSFAGPLALMLAEAERRKVRGVILAASFVRSPNPHLSRLRFALSAPAVWVWRAARRLPLWLLMPKNDAMRRAKSETWRRVPAKIVTARLRAIHAVDASALLQRCRQPVLYIASSHDGIVPSHNAHDVLQLLPTAKFVTIAGPHLALFTNPEAASRAISAFSHQAVMASPVYRAASA